MRQVTVLVAKTQLSRLIDETLRGEEIVIARGKMPVVKLVALTSVERGARRLGSAKGEVRMARDFDAPLADMDDYQPG
jgi:antitoxin (DNA-binding transcriptional repressor) of toxin-antitoxin stability system